MKPVLGRSGRGAFFAGQQIAIAEFGGGYFDDDLTAYCTKFGRPKPWVKTVSVGLPRAAKPVTLSISWGLPEDAADWTSGARNAINNRLQALALLGITVCVSSGDDGSGDQIDDGRAHVDFPSCSPFVLSAGGATGGGISVFFSRPSWQKVQIASINQPSIDGRVMPDVAAIAGAPGYTLVLLGHTTVNGGTSASAPALGGADRADQRAPSRREEAAIPDAAALHRRRRRKGARFSPLPRRDERQQHVRSGAGERLHGQRRIRRRVRQGRPGRNEAPSASKLKQVADR